MSECMNARERARERGGGIRAVNLLNVDQRTESAVCAQGMLVARCSGPGGSRPCVRLCACVRLCLGVSLRVLVCVQPALIRVTDSDVRLDENR